jgi:hypothetical protein
MLRHNGYRNLNSRGSVLCLLIKKAGRRAPLTLRTLLSKGCPTRPLQTGAVPTIVAPTHYKSGASAHAEFDATHRVSGGHLCSLLH